MITQVRDHRDFIEMEKNISCVVLVTGRGCRACMRFKKPFYTLSRENEGVDMYELYLNDISIGKPLNRSIMRYAKDKGVNTIPSILFHDGDSVTMMKVNPKNLDEIEYMIRNM